MQHALTILQHQYFAYDYGYGLSQYMGDDIMVTLYEGIVNEKFESWVQGREQYTNIVDSEIEVYN